MKDRGIKMKYTFPHIDHIDQVRDAIKAHGGTEFIEAERDGFTVFNYLVNMPDTFPSIDNLIINKDHAAILRECRGLTFYPDGTVAARKFHKFFNLNERRETDFPKVDWTMDHVILEKLDGSMITPFLTVDKEIHWHTKMGKTDVADMTLPFIAKNPNYEKFATLSIASGLTPIFEFCSRKNRIVIDHPVDRLVLLAMRDNVSGEYMLYEEMRVEAERFDIELVKQYEGTVENMEHFIEEARGEQDIEGYVIRFADGHMLKVKADVYVTLHRAVSQLQQEKDVWRLVLEDKVDDLKAILAEEMRDHLDDFQESLIKEVDRITYEINGAFDAAQVELDKTDYSVFENGDAERKKMFAIHYAPTVEDDHKGIMFKAYDGGDIRDEVVAWAIRGTGTGSKVDRMRKHFNGIVWDAYGDE